MYCYAIRENTRVGFCRRRWVIAGALLGWVMLQGGPVAAAGIVIDFNGDGYQDLAVGVPDEDIGGVVDAGAVRVFYGAADGLGGSDQLWHLNSAGVPLQAASGDRLGSAVAAGDFDGDGYSDLAIGIPFKGNTKGSVLVLYGGADGLSAGGSQIWDQDILEDTPERDDRFGSALAAGDFNADGYSDLAIGVPGEDFPDVGPMTEDPPVPKCDGSCRNAGIVNMVYGSAAGLNAAGNHVWNQDRGISYDGWVEWEDCFGASLAAGDFDGNGVDDLVVGVPCEHTGDGNVAGRNHGAVSVYLGLPRTGLTGNRAQYLRQWTEGGEGTPQGDDAFGYALAVGDFNGDGNDDLAIGVPGEGAPDIPDGEDAGAVAVYYGKAGANLSPSTRNELLSRNRVGFSGSTAGSRWGAGLAAADFNQDGFVDLAVGAPLDNIGTATGAGSVTILYGRVSRFTNKPVNRQLISQNSSGIDGIAQTYDLFGYSPRAGDFNGDGTPDLAVAAPFENVNGMADSGVVNILYGMAFTGITGAGNRALDQGGASSLEGIEEGDHFGGHLPPLLFGRIWSEAPPVGGEVAAELGGAATVAAANVNLTSEGLEDWIHWGRATEPDRKAGVTARISDYTPIGSPDPTTQVSSRYAWSDGAPRAVMTATKTGLWAFQPGRGFEFTVPADTDMRTLKVYVGANAARGQFVAALSDGSLPPYRVAIDQKSGRSTRVVALNFRAATPGQTLTVRYTVDTLYRLDLTSWVTLESAALQRR